MTMHSCLVQVLAKPDDEVAKVWLEDCRHSFAQMIHDKLTRDAEEAKTKVRAHRACCLVWQLPDLVFDEMARLLCLLAEGTWPCHYLPQPCRYERSVHACRHVICE